MMAAAFSRMSTGMKMLMKDDNRQAAKILMDGCNMGIQVHLRLPEPVCGSLQGKHGPGGPSDPDRGSPQG